MSGFALLSQGDRLAPAKQAPGYQKRRAERAAHFKGLRLAVQGAGGRPRLRRGLPHSLTSRLFEYCFRSDSAKRNAH